MKRMEDKLYNHVDLVSLLGIVDLEAGQTVAGGRGYYLLNEGVLLNQVWWGYVHAEVSYYLLIEL